MPNVEMLRLVQKQIHNEPESWNQRYWFTRSRRFMNEAWCGTRACVAGTAALLDGWSPAWEEGPTYSMTGHVHKDGVVAYVGDVARELLNLHEDEANELFFGSNSLDTVDELIDQLCEREEHG